MAGVTRGNVYSLVAAQFYRLTSTGFPVGQLDPASLSNNTTSHAYKIEGTTEATIPEFERGVITFRDGTLVQGLVDSGLETVPSVTITTNAYDATLNKLFTGVNVDTTTITNATISSTGNNKRSLYLVGAILTAKVFSRDAATISSSSYINFIVPMCEATVSNPSLNQNSGENPSTATITLRPRAGSKLPVGAALGTNQNFQDNKEFLYSITSEYPYALSMYVQDASTTTYTTLYLPVYSTITDGKTNNLYAQNGTVTAPTSHSVSTGAVVMAAAGTAAQIHASLYQSNFVLSA